MIVCKIKILPWNLILTILAIGGTEEITRLFNKALQEM
jgi:hypothetical protein